MIPFERMIYERVPSLRDIEFYDSCVIIADKQLPQQFLSILPSPILIAPGEKQKSLAAIEVLAEEVLARRSTKPLTLVAVGGGSLGDAVGFLACILWRGVSLWHIPTTLLAMVDSAHGGKTAVNLGTAKNQLGTFYPAQRTIIVDEFLETLPCSLRREGLAELLKALWLADEDVTGSLTAETTERLATAPYHEIKTQIGELIEKAIRIKLDIVKQDPYETRGIRTVLNLGHTIGHALELTASIPHGHAVAWGLAAALDRSKEFGLDEAAGKKLRTMLYPLLAPIRSLPDRSLLLKSIALDKKRHQGVLRSVVLQGVGKPIVTESISPEEWVAAFEREAEEIRSTSIRVRLTHNPRRTMIRVEASKSELNRALIISALRPGKTTIIGRSSSDDVTHLINALRSLRVPFEDTNDGYVVDSSNLEEPPSVDQSRTIYCGEGGTTFRFLLAFASMNRKETRLIASPSLLNRPQEPLIRALRNGGAAIQPFENHTGRGYLVRGWDSMPLSFSVDPSESSQFASAIALLAAGSETPFTLRLLGKVASKSYLEMTIRMLESVGVETIWHNDLIALNPTDRLREPHTIRAAPDASSEAVWKVAQFLEHPLLLPEYQAEKHLQPDVSIDRFLDAIYTQQQSDEITLDLSQAPDLVPVLIIAAMRSSKPVRLTGIGHLRYKESNRIEGIVESLSALGIRLQAFEDGIVIPPGAAFAAEEGLFNTRNDHRFAMAGLLLSMLIGPVNVSHPWCVSKSYPDFWNDARAAGWTITPNF